MPVVMGSLVYNDSVLKQLFGVHRLNAEQLFGVHRLSVENSSWVYTDSVLKQLSYSLSPEAFFSS